MGKEAELERAQGCLGFLSARNEWWWLTATVCSNLSLQVGKTKVGESQLLLSLRFHAERGLASLSVVMLNPEQSTTWLAAPSRSSSK